MTDPSIEPAAPKPARARKAPAPAAVADAEAPAPAAPQKKSNAGPVVAALAVGAILGGASGAGVATLAITSTQNGAPAAVGTPQTITVNDSDAVSAVTAIAAKASPSVVTIAVSANSAGGTGSGIVLSSDGYVLTNTHVVTLDGASADGRIEVTTYDGKLYKAKIVGIDPIVDLAVIKLTGASGLQPIAFADSSRLNVGDQAVAIGAPLGLSNTVTDGIVSALNRSIQIASSAVPEDTSEQDSGEGGGNGNGSEGGPFDFWNFGQAPGGGSTTQSASISIPVVQTDAAINPGNSGGALVNSQGELIGVNVAIASAGGNNTGSQSGSIGVGFAIPANLAQRVADEIIKDGEATHGLLGATVRDADSDTSDTVGALINDVTGGGAAEKAGVQPGDVITEFNGLPITGSTDLTAQVRALAAGSTTSLTYVRDGQATTVNVKLGKLG
ncbi:MAG TPA: trypsin-like peptidase domain-containing protein [Pseudolysinimonas sp.]|nr:trypsin-like peptidase domain-containing protein [Pseudolysinimonas sp.]